MDGGKIKPLLMVMNMLIHINLIHDRKSIHHIPVSKQDDLIIIGEKVKPMR